MLKKHVGSLPSHLCLHICGERARECSVSLRMIVYMFYGLWLCDWRTVTVTICTHI